MARRGLFKDDHIFEEMFYEENDRRKFAHRRIFLFLGVQTFALFGVLDAVMGGATADQLFWIRIVTAVILSFIWGVFATATEHRLREGCIFAFAATSATSVMLMVVVAQGPAADYYPFALSAILIFGGGLVVPQFRTIAINCTAGFIAFWCVVHLGQTSWPSIYANAFLLSVTVISVIIGSYTREAMERDQFRKEHELAAARDDALQKSHEAIEANKAKSHMMANVSHELRTPMNAIIGFSEIIKTEVFGPVEQPKYREYIEDIHNSGRLLLSNIDDLLDIARIDSGKMGWHDSTFPIAKAMDLAAKTSQTALIDNSIRIVWHDESNGAQVRGDFDRTSQALINLLNNAGKFSPANSVIEMAFACTQEGWALTVADEGCGIPAEDLERIRQPFAQVGPESFSVAKGGLGLGLAITGEIVRRLDGTLDIDSILDEGTTVTLHLPDHRVQTGATAIAQNAA